jgi:hypothetical protein
LLRENIKGRGRSPAAFKKHETINNLLYNEPAIAPLLPKGQDFIIKTCVLIYILLPTSKSLLGIPVFSYFIGDENDKNNIKRLINLNGCKLNAFDLGGHRNCFFDFPSCLEWQIRPALGGRWRDKVRFWWWMMSWGRASRCG